MWGDGGKEKEHKENHPGPRNISRTRALGAYADCWVDHWKRQFSSSQRRVLECWFGRRWYGARTNGALVPPLHR